MNNNNNSRVYQWRMKPNIDNEHKMLRMRCRRNSDSSLESVPRSCTPDPGKLERNVKQLYSPLVGIRSRNDFRRRSVGGLPSRRGPSEPPPCGNSSRSQAGNLVSGNGQMRQQMSAKNQSLAAFSHIPVNPEKNARHENILMSPENTQHEDKMHEKCQEESMSDRSIQNIDIEKAICKLSENLIKLKSSPTLEDRLTFDKLCELKHEVTLQKIFPEVIMSLLLFRKRSLRTITTVLMMSLQR